MCGFDGSVERALAAWTVVLGETGRRTVLRAERQSIMNVFMYRKKDGYCTSRVNRVFVVLLLLRRTFTTHRSMTIGRQLFGGPSSRLASSSRPTTALLHDEILSFPSTNSQHVRSLLFGFEEKDSPIRNPSSLVFTHTHDGCLSPLTSLHGFLPQLLQNAGTDTIRPKYQTHHLGQ